MRSWQPSTIAKQAQQIADMANQIEALLAFRDKEIVVQSDKFKEDLHVRADQLNGAIEAFCMLDFSNILRELVEPL